mgnify:CR=1 FL=1
MEQKNELILPDPFDASIDYESEIYNAYDNADTMQYLASISKQGVDPDVPSKDVPEFAAATEQLKDPAGFTYDFGRPELQNEDGSMSTEETVTVPSWALGRDDNRFYLIPTIVNGERVDLDTAVQDATKRVQNGEILPNFDTEEEAGKAAAARSQWIASKKAEFAERGGPSWYERGGYLDQTVVGGVVDAANQAVQIGYELVEHDLEKLQQEVGITYRDDLTGQEVPTEYVVAFDPPPQFDSREKASSWHAQMLRDITTFVSAFVLTRNAAPATTAGYGTQTAVTGARSALAATFFDPENGGLVRALQSGFGLEMLSVLDAANDADLTQAEGRLRARMQYALEDGVAGAMIEGTLQFLRFARKHPKIMNSIVATMTTAGLVYSPDTEAGVGSGVIGRLTGRDKINVAQSLAGQPAKVVKEAEAEVRRIKAQYPEADGWVKLNVQDPSGKSPSIKINKSGKIQITWASPRYAFDKPPKNVSLAEHQENITTRLVDDVTNVVERAKNGDQAAIDILKEASWYRSMRSKLREEFGGLGDVFADLLGATSANTPVRTNWDFAIDILRRYTNGDFDNEIQAYLARVEAGEAVDPNTLTKLYKSGEFPLLTQATDALYGMNSPAAMKALVDQFRQIKAGQSPKTINFTGNLIGYGNEATIDVWAARYLRDAAGLPRIPPPAEQGIAGTHLTGSTLDNQRISGEFGFGQRVFNAAATQINKSGIVKNYDSEIGDLGPDDLQAVAWFMEKEKWTKNGWTTKAGEGGSFDFEAGLAGSADPVEVNRLRSIINSSKSTPQEVGEAQAALEALRAPVERRVTGISRERPEQRPTNVEQAELSNEVLAPVKDDPTVVAKQANNSYGVFGGTPERSLNVEIVTRSDFNETAFVDNIVDLGRKYDQDAVYVSKVVPEGTAGAMPGVEVFFKSRAEADKAIALIDSLRQKYDIGGGTIITDARYKDRPDVQVSSDSEVAGAVGIRLQYIPEFEGGVADPEAAIKKFYEITADMMGEADVSSANIVFFENQVFKNTDRPGAEWIEGGVSYEDSVRNRAGAGSKDGSRSEPPTSQNAESSTTGKQDGQD